MSRDQVVIEAMVDSAITWPGLSSFTMSLTSGEQIGGLMLKVLNIDLIAIDDERLVRVVSATVGLTVTALEAIKTGQVRERRDVITRSAMGALGHDSRGSQIAPPIERGEASR